MGFVETVSTDFRFLVYFSFSFWVLTLFSSAFTGGRSRFSGRALFSPITSKSHRLAPFCFAYSYKKSRTRLCRLNCSFSPRSYRLLNPRASVSCVA
uniref:Putative cytotoxin-like protein n=1 Tax=Ixodes ricinus TaxID=34613 RepID=A0A0K8RDL7_IXORI